MQEYVRRRAARKQQPWCIPSITPLHLCSISTLVAPSILCPFLFLLFLPLCLVSLPFFSWSPGPFHGSAGSWVVKPCQGRGCKSVSPCLRRFPGAQQTQQSQTGVDGQMFHTHGETHKQTVNTKHTHTHTQTHGASQSA